MQDWIKKRKELNFELPKEKGGVWGEEDIFREREGNDIQTISYCLNQKPGSKICGCQMAGGGGEGRRGKLENLGLADANYYIE